MLEPLEQLAPDPILGLMAAFRADDSPNKVDLGVGVYRDERGETPVFEAVRSAEQALLARQTTKTYVGATGNVAFNQAMERLVLGAAHSAVTSGRLRTIQAVGGCGALRLGAELIRRAARDAVAYVPTPTWANHMPLLSGCGLALQSYPYFSAKTGGVDFTAMLSALERLPERSVIVLHACCHNPTGADLTSEQWRELLQLFKRRRLFPFIDLAYQGLGVGLDEDAFGARLFCSELPEVAVAVSCSKNFGLYRERTGALHVITESNGAADASLSQLVQIARSLYSMPPDHGAELVRAMLADERLRESWASELARMRDRMQHLRRGFVRELALASPNRSFEFITSQRGMFSYLGIPPEQVRALRSRHHIYMTEDSRINIAGLHDETLAYVAHAVADVLRQ